MQVSMTTSWKRWVSNNLLEDTTGAQIVEFAVTLPLLVAIFVGIYDFTNAFNLKQKLTVAVREGARFSSNQSTSDLTNSTPNSILATRDVIDTYLLRTNVNDCGLGTATASSAGNLTWQFTATGNNCPSPGLTLTIQRGLVVPYTPAGGNAVHVESTQVTLTYTYQWQFGHVATLLVPGAQYGSSQIPISAVMQNLN
jgi:Flp pilus assembly protein TadG